MAPRTNREVELEKELAELRGRLDMLSSLAVGTARNTNGKAVVGIRNISNYTIGLVNKVKGEEGELQLAPEWPDKPNVDARAVISEQYWQMLRKEKPVRLGMIIRDDSFISDANLAPPDRPEDIPPEAVVNRIEDPFAWIEARDDAELREGVAAITSEPTLRRLYWAVDRKIWEIGEALYKDDEQRARKAIRDLPSKYRYLEQLVLDRLDEFRPNHENYANERNTQARF